MKASSKATKGPVTDMEKMHRVLIPAARRVDQVPKYREVPEPPVWVTTTIQTVTTYGAYEQPF